MQIPLLTRLRAASAAIALLTLAAAAATATATATITKALPFVDPASGLVLAPLRQSTVVAHLGAPEESPAPAPQAGAASDLRLRYPALGLSFLVLAADRTAADPVVSSMRVDGPRDADAAPSVAAAPAPGLHVGMDRQAFDTLAAQHYRIVRDGRDGAQADGVVTLGPAAGSAERRLHVTLHQGRVHSLLFSTADPPGRAEAAIRVLPMAAGLTGLVAMGWVIRRPLRRAWDATGSAAPPPRWGLGQVLRHLFGMPLVLGGAALAVQAWRLLQQPGLYEQKVGPLVAVGAVSALLLGAALLVASHHRAVARPALVLLILILVGITIGELYYGYV